MPAPLSVQLYSLGAAPATDLDGTIARLADLGFAAVEPVVSTGASEQMREFAKNLGAEHLPPDVDTTALKRALDAHGMVAPSSHVQLPDGEHAHEILDEQEMLGSTTLVTAALFDPESGSLEAFNDLDRIKVLAERFNRAAELARQSRDTRRLPQPLLGVRHRLRRPVRDGGVLRVVRAGGGCGGGRLLGPAGWSRPG